MTNGYSAAPRFDATPPKAIPLSELLGYVRSTINNQFRGNYWIVAEITGLSVRQHYYFDLAEMQRGQVVAKARANMWEGIAQRVIPRFMNITGKRPQVGMSVMMLVGIDMHLSYGMSLTVYDINPEFTLGDLERKRKETIERLSKEGLLELNRSLHLPLLLQRVAVISSETAAGWGDFLKHIEQSGFASFLQVDLYPAMMQGENTTPTIYNAFLKILKRRADYQAVFILRGGGSKMDLSAFDDYLLSTYIANFPLPVLTAIGHEQDLSVADLVAHTHLKTPTALAEFFIQRIKDQLTRYLTNSSRLKDLLEARRLVINQTQETSIRRLQSLLVQYERKEQKKIYSMSQKLLYRLLMTTQGIRNESEESLSRFRSYLRSFPTLILEKYHRHKERTRQLLLLSNKRAEQSAQTLEAAQGRLLRKLQNLPSEESKRVDVLEKIARAYNPEVLMLRGFLPVLHNGEKLSSIQTLQEGDLLRILALDGEIHTVITELKKQHPSK